MRASIRVTLAALLAGFCAGACSQALTRTATCETSSECGAGFLCSAGVCQSAPVDAGSDAGAPIIDAGAPGLDGGADAGFDAGVDAGSDAGLDAGPDAGTFDAGPDGGSVGYDGGTVDLIDFSITGDTRPGFCDLVGSYPTAIIQSEATAMAALPSQFAVDLGDHMYACLPVDSTASKQMQLYVGAVSGYPHPWFMTMGNHECYADLDCSNSVSMSSDPNYLAYMAALPTVSHQSLPYYSIDVHTRFGLVRLIFVADDFASSEQQVWLTQILSDSDVNAVHTIVLKHHPITGSDTGPSWMWPLITPHKISLLLTAHEHDYEHDLTEMGGRTVICGLGGANTANTGFCRVQQRDDNSLAFTEYDLNGDPLDTWSVTPP